MPDIHLEKHFLLWILAVILVLNFFVFLPYFSAIILAAVFAIIFRPVYLGFLRRLGGSEGLAALLTVVLVLLIVLLPLMFISIQLFREATDLYFWLADGESGGLQALEESIRSFAPAVSLNLNEYLRQILIWFLENISAIFSGLARALVSLILGLAGFYYLLKDGPRFESRLVALIPLSGEYAKIILERLSRTVNSVVKKSLVVAVVQGILAGVGFAFFGVPNPVFWGSLTVFAALVPAVGTSLILVPAVLYLFLTGNFGSAIGLLVWGAAAVGPIDNFLGPHLIRRGGVEIHPFLILLSVLGGISFLGPIGFLVGPLALSLLFALFDIYSMLILKREIAS